MALKIISAGAGSGKTHRLTSEMVSLLASGEVRASGVIATTFTKKAAAELQERVRVRLLEEGLTEAANDLANSLIGTVHSLGVKLLKRFAFEAGVSPAVDIIADEDQQVMFNLSLAMVLTNERVEEMERLASVLGLNKSDRFKTDWRKVLKDLTEVARANDFSFETLEKSKHLSFESFHEFLKPDAGELERVQNLKAELPTAKAWNDALGQHLEEAISRLENNGDTTKTTADAVKFLKESKMELRLRGVLFWHQWAKIAKIKVAVKSQDDVAPLVDFANLHLFHPGFQADIKAFIHHLFDLAKDAILEFDGYKKHRGLIDYTDMEVLVKNLLDEPAVQEVLKEELDLLMVDEFQDTSPIQLEIFLKLSRFARHSVWVGDTKQSIYGFRGAEPKLMDAIIRHSGGLKKENILAYSWRSRPDIVNATNAIFTKAFSHLPPEQIALHPQRTDDLLDQQVSASIFENATAIRHWHFKYDGEGKAASKEWFFNCTAVQLKTFLERGVWTVPKGEEAARKAKPGDVAILCRTNNDCQDMAEALHKAGVRASISRAGLLTTAESKLILACLKFILNPNDQLSLAEILLLASRLGIEEIIEDRLDFLQKEELAKQGPKWGAQHELVQRLHQLRLQVVELSGNEILHLILEELDLRRIVVAWGNLDQRLANIEVLCSLAQRYEETCNRLHAAASLGGFLLWLYDIESNGKDLQASGENPEAVNVLTYHRSKGLEYPIVLCHNLENPLRADVWGISLVAEKPEVDLQKLLGNRWLRYWANPYSDQFNSTVLQKRIDGSAAKSEKLKEALEEEARLLYVGATRARDYLVFPTREKPAIWLNRVCNNGQDDASVLLPAAPESPWEWEEKGIEVHAETIHFPNDFPHADTFSEEVFFLEKRFGNLAHEQFRLDPAQTLESNKLTVTIGEEEGFWRPLPVPEVQERAVVAKALHAFLMADQLNVSEKNRLERAASILERFGVIGFLEPQALTKASSAFFKWVSDHHDIVKLYKMYPLRYSGQGQVFEATVDFVIVTPSGLQLILNSPFVGEYKHRMKKAKEIAATLYQCKVAAQQKFNLVNVETSINFLLYSKMVKVGVM